MSTSRVARKPVTLPSGVQVAIQNEMISVKGPKGTLAYAMHPDVEVDVAEGRVQVRPNQKAKYCRTGTGAKLRRSIAGTTRAKIHNMVLGVSQGFERKLMLVGVGYRAQVKGNLLTLTIGFSHPVTFKAPDGITFEAPSVTEIIVKGIDKHLVGHAAAMIRGFRGPEPYKGKGIRYADERVVRKETKKK